VQPTNGLRFVGKEAVGERQLLRLDADGVCAQAGKHLLGAGPAGAWWYFPTTGGVAASVARGGLARLAGKSSAGVGQQAVCPDGSAKGRVT
jgi:hypothetical protein